MPKNKVDSPAFVYNDSILVSKKHKDKPKALKRDSIYNIDMLF